MAQVIYSGEALADFERIIEFLLETSVDSATQALVSIRSAVGILEAHPLIGRRVDGHIRELVISERATGYLALYRFDAAFNVVRILRGDCRRSAGPWYRTAGRGCASARPGGASSGAPI